MVADFMFKRRALKNAREALRQATHLRNLREDLFSPIDSRDLAEAEGRVVRAIEAGDPTEIDKSADALVMQVRRLIPIRRHQSLRENLEILVVAVAVAMAFRAYFVQPFKIPTGSMQPTLFGIQSQTGVEPGILDKYPLRLFKWFVTGEWYKEVVVTTPGELSPAMGVPDNPAIKVYFIGNKRYAVPRDAELNNHVLPGSFMPRGAILWSGVTKAGDHVFVNKVAWNFRRPRRGEIMVFKTDNIPDLPQQTHYIKRMAGVPGDTVAISAPNLIVNGVLYREKTPITAISLHQRPYDRPPYDYGYIPPHPVEGRILRTPGETVTLKPHQYLALGDNTSNSKDSRYWGTVPEANLVGPAFFVYWPFYQGNGGYQRWGLAR